MSTDLAADFFKNMNTKKRRYNFYCTASNNWVSGEALALLMIQQFEKIGDQRQGALIYRWFCENQVPEWLQKDKYISDLNYSPSDIATVRRGTDTIKDLRKNERSGFARMVDLHGGGLKGFVRTMQRKSLNNDSFVGIFAELKLAIIREGLLGNVNVMPVGVKNGSWNPDKPCKPNGTYDQQSKALRLYLQCHGFDTADLGLWQ